MAERIAADNEKEVKISKEARKLVNKTKKAEVVGDETLDEAWVKNMPEHVVKATKGPAENVTKARIPYYPGLVNEPVMVAVAPKPAAEPVNSNVPKTKNLPEGVKQLVEEASR